MRENQNSRQNKGVGERERKRKEKNRIERKRTRKKKKKQRVLAKGTGDRTPVTATKKGVPGHHCLRTPEEKRRLPTLPHCIAVPSAQAGLTSLFGMGRGGTPPL